MVSEGRTDVKMKLWLLKSCSAGEKYDTYNGFVVRASTERRARAMAEAMPSDDVVGHWQDPFKTTCEELRAEGQSEVVLGSFNAG